MRSFRSEPFLWIHLAGIAVAPLGLLVVCLALAIGDPLNPLLVRASRLNSDRGCTYLLDAVEPPL